MSGVQTAETIGMAERPEALPKDLRRNRAADTFDLLSRQTLHRVCEQRVVERHVGLTLIRTGHRLLETIFQSIRRIDEGNAAARAEL